MSTTIDARAAGTALHHHWSPVVGAGRAAEALRAGWLEQLGRARRECGFASVRFHGLFHDDMFVARLADGRLHTSWRYIDEVIDRLLATGVRPFIELGFCPGDLARRRETVFWWKGHGSPPSDFALWEELVGRFARHCLERWGADEVRNWWFEVWNEPNHAVFFDGTRSEYFELYRRSARALKAADPALRVGGPATANFVPDDRFAGEREDPSRHANHREADQDRLSWRGVWIEEFLDFCAREGLPVDFVSAHPYPMDWAGDGHGGMRNYFRSVTALRDDLAWLRRTVAASAFPQAAIHCTEWNTSSAFGDPAHDELCAATYVVEANILATGLADSVAYWTFTDVFEEAGGRPGLLHGGFGMLNGRGLAKPVYHAYRFLAGLGRRELARGDGWIATTGPHLSLLAWNYPAGWRTGLPLHYTDRGPVLAALDDGSPRRFAIAITGLEPRQPLAIEVLSRRHGSLPDAWRAVAEADPPAPAHLDWLARAADGTLVQLAAADQAGRFAWEVELPPWAIARLVALPPQPAERHAPLAAARSQPMAADPL